MERHVAELTSTRDIRMNAQRIALVGHGTESMRDEIQQLKTEIERIEKERVRLATERDRIESEFAGLQSRLNLAPSSHTETLERLDEARAALAVTEKEHDEAVSKLQYVHEPETKPLEVIAEPAEQHQTPEEVIVNQADTLGQEGTAKEPAQELVVREQRDEAALGDLMPQPALDKPEHEPELKEPTQEPLLNEPEPEPALSLLTNEPLPAVIPTSDPYPLESEFFTEETLDAHRVSALRPNDAANCPFCYLKPAGFRTPNRHVAGCKSLLIDSCTFDVAISEPKLFYRLIDDETDLCAFLCARIVPIHDRAAKGKAFQERRLGRVIDDRENAIPIIDPEVE